MRETNGAVMVKQGCNGENGAGKDKSLENISNLACNLLGRYSAVTECAVRLSEDKLLQAIIRVHNGLDRGCLVDPPTTFVSMVQRSMPRKERVRLEHALDAWVRLTTEDLTLHPGALESWALRVLWETCLINECQQRIAARV